MLLSNQVKYASNLELLSAVLGNRRQAQILLHSARGSLFALLHQAPQEHGDLFCSEGKGSYAGDPITKLHAARELTARAITEDLKQGDALSSPGAVRDVLKLRLAGLGYEVFVVLLLDAQNRVL